TLTAAHQTFSLHDALPIYRRSLAASCRLHHLPMLSLLPGGHRSIRRSRDPVGDALYLTLERNHLLADLATLRSQVASHVVRDQPLRPPRAKPGRELLERAD